MISLHRSNHVHGKYFVSKAYLFVQYIAYEIQLENIEVEIMKWILDLTGLERPRNRGSNGQFVWTWQWTLRSITVENSLTSSATLNCTKKAVHPWSELVTRFDGKSTTPLFKKYKYHKRLYRSVGRHFINIIKHKSLSGQKNSVL